MVAPRVNDGLETISPREKSERKELLALSIEQACEALKKLLNSGLNRNAIITLVAADTKLPKTTIGQVLNSLQDLSKTYCS